MLLCLIGCWLVHILLPGSDDWNPKGKIVGWEVEITVGWYFPNQPCYSTSWWGWSEQSVPGETSYIIFQVREKWKWMAPCSNSMKNFKTAEHQTKWGALLGVQHCMTAQIKCSQARAGVLWFSLHFLAVEKGLLEIIPRGRSACERRAGHPLSQLSACWLANLSHPWWRGMERRMDRDSRAELGQWRWSACPHLARQECRRFLWVSTSWGGNWGGIPMTGIQGWVLTGCAEKSLARWPFSPETATPHPTWKSSPRGGTGHQAVLADRTRPVASPFQLLSPNPHHTPTSNPGAKSILMGERGKRSPLPTPSFAGHWGRRG